jgi:SAM-dependent methyltransferase
MGERSPDESAPAVNAFDDPAVARAYRLRPSYPPRVFDELLKLLGTRPGWIVEVGAGTGLLTRTLARHVGRIDAIESSAAMVEEARVQPGGRERAIRWIVSRAEDARLNGPYGLAVAGDSLHLMDAQVVVPRVADALAPGAFLAIVEMRTTAPWDEELEAIVGRFAAPSARDTGFSVADDLTRRELWKPQGELEIEPVSRRQKIDDYIESFHAHRALTRRQLGKEAFAFDEAMRGLARRHGATDVELRTSATIWWGVPIGTGAPPPAPAPRAPRPRGAGAWRRRRRA